MEATSMSGAPINTDRLGFCISDETSEKLALAARVALVVVVVLGFVAAAVFSGGAAVAAPGVALLATYTILCIGSAIGAISTGFVADNFGMFEKRSENANACGFMVVSLFIPLYVTGKIICHAFPCILICLALQGRR